MKKILYLILMVVFAIVTSLARIIWFSNSSIWSYVMGMTYMALCGITATYLDARGE